MVVGVYNKRAVGIFSHRGDAENALHELKKSGFPMEHASVIAQDTDSNNMSGAEVREKVGNKADEGASLGAATGGTLGGLTGLLVGLGTLAIPGVGPVMLAGATATAIATTLAGAGIGAAAGGLLGGLIGLGIPEEEARAYNARVERGHYLVIIDGTDAEIASAERILRHSGIEDFAIYDQPNQPHHEYGTADVYPAVVTPVAGNTALGYTPGVNAQPIIRNKRAVGVFLYRRNAEAALTDLRNAGIAMDNVSIIGKDTGNNVNPVSGTEMHGNKADDGAKTGAATGAALGGLGGLLVGLGALAIPGIGPVIAGGAAATALATALTGGAIGAAAGGLLGGLVGLGIPEKQAQVYSDRLNRGDYIVMVDGSEDEVRRAETILKRHGIEDFDIFNATDISNRDRETPTMDSSRANYTADIDRDNAIASDAPVIIIDRRDETI
ncbi:MAG: histidine kinase [Calothrix sp. CSU_2_0]|nr:histidine kinase [Calothrix sp. CSU_2_0]